MAITNFQSTKWSATAEYNALEQAVALSVTNTSYQTELEGVKSLNINLIGSITTGTYTKNTNITLTALTDSQKTLTMDQDKYFAFPVDKGNLEQSQADYMTKAMEAAGMTIANEVDDYAFGSTTYGDTNIPAANKFGTLAVPIAITTSNIESYLSKMSTALRLNNAPGQKICMVTPEVMSVIRQAAISAITDNSAEWNGRTISQYAGMIIVETTNLTEEATADGWQILAFSERAIATGVTLSEMSVVENPLQFGYICKGRYLFGSEVIFPNEVSVLSATVA